MSAIDMTIIDIDQVIDISECSNGPIEMITNEVTDAGGTKNYNDLNNKPKIEGVELVGNKTYEELNLSSLTNTEIENMLDASV